MLRAVGLVPTESHLTKLTSSFAEGSNVMYLYITSSLFKLIASSVERSIYYGKKLERNFLIYLSLAMKFIAESRVGIEELVPMAREVSN